jgi:hypothetical protein
LTHTWKRVKKAQFLQPQPSYPLQDVSTFWSKRVVFEKYLPESRCRSQRLDPPSYFLDLAKVILAKGGGDVVVGACDRST